MTALFYNYLYQRVSKTLSAKDMEFFLTLFILLLIANGTPVVARIILRDRFVLPVDGGLYFVDGKRFLGPRKTVLGLASAGFVTTLVALLLGEPWHIGLLIAAGAMTGDLLSSFVKRRLNIVPHGVVLGLDQVPEALLPLLLVKAEFALDSWGIVSILIGFCMAEWSLTYLADRFDLLHTKEG